MKLKEEVMFMTKMRIDDCVIAVFRDGDHYLVPVFVKDAETPVKVLCLTNEELIIFIEACCYTAVRKKMAVSDYVRRIKP